MRTGIRILPRGVRVLDVPSALEYDAMSLTAADGWLRRFRCQRCHIAEPGGVTDGRQ